MNSELKIWIASITAILVMGMIISCNGPSDSGEFPGVDLPPVTYTLSASSSPTQGGSVNPSSGTFDEGETVSVEAVPSEGWEFDRWTGDIESEENPLNFEITHNTSLTANFVNTESMYTVQLQLEDEQADLDLLFGQARGATEGFDEGLDVEAPPEPPSGVLNAWFDTGELELFHDFRSSTSANVLWNLEYRIGSGTALWLSWVVDTESAEGSLILSDEEQTFEVDMLATQSYELQPAETGRLVITYTLDE